MHKLNVRLSPFPPNGLIGFVGIGCMGEPMAKRLIQAGYDLLIFDAQPQKLNNLANMGAHIAGDVRQLAQRADLTISMLPAAAQVENVILGQEGMASQMRPGSVHVDMSTIEPAACRRLAKALEERGAAFLDAPVTGGVGGAQEGTLSILVGGDFAQFERCLPVLKALGRQVTHMGEVGMGQTAKACNQVVGAVTLQAVCEGLMLAKRCGMDVERLIKAMHGGAADSFMLDYVGTRVLRQDFEPGFRIELELKDLKIALAMADECATPLPALALAEQLFLSRAAFGMGSLEGNQALYKVYQQLAGEAI